MDTKTYRCTDPQLASLEDELKQHGLSVDLSNPGTATQSGWSIGWTFPHPGEIALAVSQHPFAEEGFLWKKLTGIFGPSI